MTATINAATLAQLHAVATNETLPMALRIAALQNLETSTVSVQAVTYDFLMANEQDVISYTAEHGASVTA